METEINKELGIVLSKMFEVVGETYTPDKVKNPNWFLAHTWTALNQKLFKEWLSKHIRESASARNALTVLRVKPTKTLADKFADEFVFNYGWKLE